MWANIYWQPNRIIIRKFWNAPGVSKAQFLSFWDLWFCFASLIHKSDSHTKLTLWSSWDIQNYGEFYSWCGPDWGPMNKVKVSQTKFKICTFFKALGIPTLNHESGLFTELGSSCLRLWLSLQKREWFLHFFLQVSLHKFWSLHFLSFWVTFFKRPSNSEFWS